MRVDSKLTLGRFRNISISTIPKIFLLRAFGMKSTKPLMKIRSERLPLWYQSQHPNYFLLLSYRVCVYHRTICHRHASINSLRQQNLCLTLWPQNYICFYQAPLSTSLNILDMGLNIGAVIISTLIFPCILTRSHVKHLAILITACPINLHSSFSCDSHVINWLRTNSN